MSIYYNQGRYDNLHSDEDEIELTREEIDELQEQEADLENDQQVIEDWEWRVF